MFRSATPIAVFSAANPHSSVARARMLEGRPDSIHDARIATRRIREVLPLLPTMAARQWPRSVHTDQAIGRSLGKVRDADARIGLLRT